ncbi:hypothetical protein L210DRAFT_2608514 [Boletus edulis BED1]|uniref:Protein kinase domain-containing protein n=1 Tax=Boletus edulis BED1 TaxID=1328754 RepID=A0AAD4BAK2_BOLED|nr:hypothetical protein L210DRAFT_2608514 [Boletus edulis BED1]
MPARFVGHELAPVLKDTLSVSADLLAFTPFPGLEEAAKALLSVWDACQKVDTNRLCCLRLAERCATLLYSVRCDIDETGVQAALAEPVERLCGALAQIRTFLDTQLHRPFLKRYVRREEIVRELQACNDAITDAASRFGLSVQIRTYREVYNAMYESKRYAQEAQALLSLDHQIIQRQYAMLCGQQRRQEVVTELSTDNALGLTADGALVSADRRQDLTLSEGGKDEGSYPMPAPAYGPPVQSPSTTTSLLSTLDKLTLTSVGSGSGRNTPTPSMLPSENPSNPTNSTLSVPPTPTPTKAAFVVEETKATTTKTLTRETEAMATYPATPVLMKALKEAHRAQDSLDAAGDEAALQGTLAGALNAQNDVEMVRCLQVARGEIPEAAETLRRMLGEKDAGLVGNQRIALEHGEHGMVKGSTELDRKFMQSGIEAMMRLTGAVTKQPQGEVEKGDLGEGAGTVCASELPSWTITRYEVIRTRKIGAGFLSDVYLAHWRKLTVVAKVLAHSVSRETFVRYIETWNTLDHPNVLPLYGASSAVGDKPWFLVSKFCSGENLVASLRRTKLVGSMVVGDKAMVRMDLLRFMHEIAKGMAYLHGCGVLHGDLRAANVLVDENGQCVLSDFCQREIKSEAHRSCGQPELYHVRWKSPEMLMGDNRPTNAADVYAFAICCIEILGMGDLPWPTLDDRTIQHLVIDKDERPPVLVPAGCGNTASAVTNLVESCWVREPELRPTFASIAASLEEVWSLHGHGSPKILRASPSFNSAVPVPMSSTESSPTDEQYETASESMRTEVEEETVDGMIDVSLTSPAPALENGSMFHVKASNHTKVVRISTQVRSGVLEYPDDTPTPSPTNKSDMNAKNEKNYRLVAGLNHTFHKSLTLPLWSPTGVELGAVGYLSKSKGEFITLFNAINPLQSTDERLRQLPSMYGYGKFEVQKREEGKRSVAQRGLDAISGFLTFKTRGDRSHPERIARQYAFPLVQGKPSAHLCVEKTVHRYMDHLEVPMTWFKQHVELILEVCAPRHAILREDLILVVGTLDATDWAVFVSTDHVDTRAQFNVFANREKGEPWGMYTVEPEVKDGDTGSGRRVDVGQGFASKVSCVTMGGNDVAGDVVMLAGLRFEQGMETPTVI